MEKEYQSRRQRRLFCLVDEIPTFLRRDHGRCSRRLEPRDPIDRL